MSTPFHVLRMTDGLMVHHCLCAAAKLGIADLLKDGARSTEDLAAALGQRGRALSHVAFSCGAGRVSRDRPSQLRKQPAVGMAARRRPGVHPFGIDLPRQPLLSHAIL